MTKSHYQKTCELLISNPRTWLITGVAGFIGSNLLEALLGMNQKVIGVDNFSTGKQSNLKAVEEMFVTDIWQNFSFFEGDITSIADCLNVTHDVDFILHQAALGSVPRSIENPLDTHHANVTGFINMLHAANQNQVSSFTFASSSSVYGDHPGLPKQEDNTGKLLSPYAVSKYTNELYASVFSEAYNFNSIGLRYFNVFGERQDPSGSYAAVIPRWIDSLQNGNDIHIFGDGETSRDFCYIKNVIQANILAATAPDDAKNHIYNISVGGQTTLTELFKILIDIVQPSHTDYNSEAIYKDYRAGDIRHSIADITKASLSLGYLPEYSLEQGLKILVQKLSSYK